MKKLNKKGFTIVELVIVIAVIGILSAVLIPTFSNLTEKANESAALQEVTNNYKEWLIEYADDSTAIIPENTIVVVDEKYDFKFDGNGFVSVAGDWSVSGKTELTDAEKAVLTGAKKQVSGQETSYVEPKFFVGTQFSFYKAN